MRRKASKFPLYQILFILLCLSIIWFKAPEQESTEETIHVMTGFLILIIPAMCLFYAIRYFSEKWMYFKRYHGTEGIHEYHITEDGIRETNTEGEILTKLKTIKSIEKSPEYYYIVTKSGLGHLFPRESEGVESFITEVKRHMG